MAPVGTTENPAPDPSLGAVAESPSGTPRRHLAELRFLSPSLFGFAFARAYYDVMSTQLTALVPSLPWLGQDVLVLGMLPAFILCVAFARRILPLYRQRTVAPLATILMLAAPIAVAIAPAVSAPHTAFLTVGALLAGLGYGLSILLWAELQSCFNSFQIVLYVSGAFFLGSLIGWLALGLEGIRLVICLAVLTLASLVCLLIGFARVRAEDLPHGFESGGLRFPWKLVCALGVYELVLGVRQGMGSFEGSTFTVGVLVAASGLFLVVYFLSHRFDFTHVYRTPFLLMSCGLLATLASLSSGSVAADLLVSTGYALMFLVLTILLCDIAHRSGVSAALLCSIEELVMLTGLAGHAASSAAAHGVLPFSPSNPIVLVVLVALIIVASAALLTEREYTRWGLSLFGMGDLVRSQGDRERKEALCAELAERFALSPREREVFLLLAENRSSQEIERELCIAEGTLKSHTRRIYRKLGIHRREELTALVSGEVGPWP